MKKFSILLFISLFLPPPSVFSQQIALKTNLVYDAMATVNAGVEVSFARKWSFEVAGNYNAWDFSDGRKWRHILVQPEFHYWLCEPMSGHFFGLHAHWSKFNLAKVRIPFGLWKDLRDKRYEGDLYGAGLTYGYALPLGRHWNLEAALGLGYARVIYDKYPCARCGTRLDSGKYNYWGVTKLAFSVAYVF
nr:DUF3575 domain-containing protein [Alistipes sp.]